MMKRVMGEAGDTIVEVLIVIAVISLVLGGAYATTNTGVKNQQQAQEHSRAAKVAESQLEALREYVENVAGESQLDTLFGLAPSETFCMSGGGVRQFTGSHPDCEVAEGGVSRYRVTMNYLGTATDVFTVKVDWEGPTIQASNVTMSYKVFRP